MKEGASLNELAGIAEFVTPERYIKELEIEARIDAQIDRQLKRLFFLNPHSPDNALSFGTACAIQI
jgi:hypothetical protein